MSRKVTTFTKTKVKNCITFFCGFLLSPTEITQEKNAKKLKSQTYDFSFKVLSGYSKN